MEGVPEVKIWLYGPAKPKFFTRLSIPRVMALENPTFVPDADKFIAFYEKHAAQKDVLVLQGHPEQWNDERWTGFTQHFGHVSTGLPPGDEQAFLATLIAEATNLGLSRMAEVCGAGSRRALLRMQTWHMREETFRAALACLTDAIHAVLCGAGHNIRLILAHLRVLVLALIGALMCALRFAVMPAARPASRLPLGG